jgi:hypothetical protein
LRANFAHDPASAARSYVTTFIKTSLFIAFLSTPAHADGLRGYYAAAVGVGVGAVEEDRVAPSRGHVRFEGGAHVESTRVLSLSTRLGLPAGGDLRKIGVPSAMLRMRYLLTSRWSGHLSAGLGFVSRRVVDETMARGVVDEAMTVFTGPVLLGIGTGYAVPIGDGLRLVVELDAISAIAPTDEFAGIAVEDGVHVEIGVGLAFVR